MRRCRKCNQEWPDTATACPNDGWSLTLGSDMTSAPPAGFGTGATVGTAQHAVAQAEPMVQQDLAPGTQVGEYRVERKIGEGGMGAVYSAVHPLIGKKAAIKVISSALGTDASAVNRFVQEARSVNQIGHPNIVDVFAFGTLPDGRNYFVMEHLQGEGLANRLQRASMSLGEAIEILDQVADALEAAHEKQIVHRDLKPDNVFLASVRGGRTMVKLLDFGIAKLSVAEGGSEGGGSGVAKTRTGMMMGTPGYLSPEQARGKNVDHRTDIYALGCMTFEIACGRLPFVADNAMDIVLAHMTQAPPHPMEIWPEIPAPLADLILKMLEKHPDNRPTLGDIRSAFAGLVSSGLVTLDASRPSTFGSGLERRIQTPSRGLPTPPAGMAVVGTQPPGSIALPAGTSPPVAGEVVPVAKKGKGGIVIAALAGVVLIGGGAAFFAMKGGDSDSKPAATTPAPTPAPAPTPPPAPAPPVVEKTVEKPTKGTLDISVDADGAQVTIDGAAHAPGKAAVDAGRHTITATADGYEKYEMPWTVEVGQTASVAIHMKKLEVAKKGPVGPSNVKKPPVAAGSAAAKPPVTTTKPPGKGSAKTDGDAPVDVQF